MVITSSAPAMSSWLMDVCWSPAATGPRRWTASCRPTSSTGVPRPDARAEHECGPLVSLSGGAGQWEALIVGGGPATAEVYQTDTRLRRLTGFTSFDDRTYPFLVPRVNGQVELVTRPTGWTMSTTGVGALTATRNRDGINRSYGSFATYDIGKVIVAGGGSVTEDGKSSVPSKTAAVVDVNGAGTTVRPTNSMSVGRRQANLTVLADGSVLATGGQSSSVNGLVDLQNPVFAAERWDPATETWTVLSSASRVRQYHSTATLLPDGRVMTGGGGIRARAPRRAIWRRTSSTSRRPICSPRTAPEARLPVR